MKKLLFWIGIGVFALIGIGIFSSQSTISDTQTSAPVTPQIIATPKIEIKQETSDEVIPYSSKTINDATLAKGLTKVTQLGVNGKITHYFNVTYTDSKETARKETKTTRVETIDQITAIGTYVAPINNNPSGATARCRDGTLSYSQNHQGTCSHHGGVAEWLD